MSALESVSHIQKLSALHPGDEFEVVEVSCARSLSKDRFSPGRRWRCLYRGKAVMLLVGPSGETIRLPLNSAHCVDVQRTEPQV